MNVRVLICGGRDFTDVALMRRAIMKHVGQLPGPPRLTVTLVHGAARGADSLAARIAAEWHWPVVAYPADWKTHGKAAGSIRNQQMLDTKPDLVLAFPTPQSRGTWDMVRRAQAAGVRTIVVTE